MPGNGALWPASETGDGAGATIGMGTISTGFPRWPAVAGGPGRGAPGAIAPTAVSTVKSWCIVTCWLFKHSSLMPKISKTLFLRGAVLS